MGSLLQGPQPFWGMPSLICDHAGKTLSAKQLPVVRISVYEFGGGNISVHNNNIGYIFTFPEIC